MPFRSNRLITSTLQKIKDFIFNRLNALPTGRQLTGFYLLAKNHLTKSGWKKSVKAGLPLDQQGVALPWFTFGAIYFLDKRLQAHFRVFEYGSGNSTLWFSHRVQRVLSVEHDPLWYAKMQDTFSMHPAISCLHRTLPDDYPAEIRNYRSEFEVIVLDGRERVRCCMNALEALTQNGVVIWDNSDRPEYRVGYDYLLANGFKRIDFYGMGPMSAHSWCTSVFYRPTNCLGI